MIEFSDFKKPVREAAVIIALACVLGFAVNLFHPEGYTFRPREDPALWKIVRIGAAEAKIKFDLGVAVFIDTRSPSEFMVSGIPGAVNIPGIPESSALAAIKANGAVLEGPVEPVIYCSGTACDGSEALARMLISLGYPRSVYVMPGGLPEWEALGYPVRKNEEDKSD
ncbi:MAG TPA: rhodanese-like domain-containing protein [Spirochaetota bacterium]|nr:rhodanese-like domain-containing protein [Spirochaetota bacterium]